MDNSEDLLERIQNEIRRVFSIEDTTIGASKDAYLVRYHGRLLLDSAEAYERLSAALHLLRVTPLFRWEDGRQTILVIDGLQDVKPGNPRTNLIFFLLTLLSVWFTGGVLSMQQLPTTLGGWISAVVTQGWPFAISMLAILSAHEFGHYFAGRFHRTHVSLPYFLPLPYPLSPFGTFGAFINMKEIPRNRRILLDIAIAGPLAGLVVAIPVLLIGLHLSTLNQLPAAANAGGMTALQLEGNSILYLLAKFSVFGKILPEPASYGGLSPLLYWVKYFFTGAPLPYGGLDVSIHPVAWAGWGGLLVTALNLIPAGQLDGGHIFYALFGGERARKLLPVLLIALVALGFFWNGWWLWAALIFFLGRYHAQPLDQITELDPRRKRLAAFMLIVFLLVFSPVPLILMP
jgi:Zn-dependent protease